MSATSLKSGTGRPSSLLGRSSASRSLDPLLQWVLSGMAAFILLLIAFFFVRLFVEAKPAFDEFGYFGFTFGNDWNVAKNIYGALPLLTGTLITSAIALVIGVPVAVAVAVYVTELCPQRLRQPLASLVELLAAVPSVVYGLWGVYVLIPKMRPVETWLSETFSFLPLVGAPVAGPNLFIGGLILSIMIVPIVSAISREVILTVPADHKEASLALGATRWEMIKMAVLPVLAVGHRGRVHARPGPGDRRDDRGDARHRQLAEHAEGHLRPGLLPGGRHRERVQRGCLRSAASRGAHRGGPRPVRPHALRERHRTQLRPQGRARPAPGPEGDGGMSATTPGLAPISTRRRASADRFARGVLLALTLIALVPLVLIVYELLRKGLGAISWDFFTTDPTGRTCFPVRRPARSAA